MMASERAAWLRRLLASVLVAVLAGALAFLVARATFGVFLFVEQQQFLAEVGNTVRNGIDGLPASNLHELRARVAALDARNQEWSIVAGFVAAGTAAVVAFLWQERRATRSYLR